jgi:hypothetical protein
MRSPPIRAHLDAFQLVALGAISMNWLNLSDHLPSLGQKNLTAVLVKIIQHRQALGFEVAYRYLHTETVI